MSLRTLKRRLKDAGMTRRTDFTPTDIVISTVTQELRGSGQLLGYRSMCQTLRQKYNLKVKRNDVMHILSRLDPYGVKRRCKRRFVRRGYFSEGPNQVWHVDGYDKLKPFGVAISACVDGFSRKVMWLSCGSSNNDPGIIAKYYMECLSRFGQLPSMPSYRLWHRKWHNGSHSLCFKIRPWRWTCRSPQSYVWYLNYKSTDWKLVVFVQKAKVHGF